jgi:hypothetical protein
LFAELKNQIGLRRLRLRRLKFVREQFFLAAAAQNIERLVRFLRVCSHRQRCNRAVKVRWLNLQLPGHPPNTFVSRVPECAKTSYVICNLCPTLSKVEDPEWPTSTQEKLRCREATGQSNSQRLRRSEIAAYNVRRVDIDPDDDSAGIDPGGITEDGSGRANAVKTPWLSRKECETAEVSVYSPTLSCSGFAPPTNVKTAPGKSIVVYVPWYNRYP